MLTDYIYPKLCDAGRLKKEIQESPIVTALDRISTQSSPEETTIWFKDGISVGDADILDTLVTNHVATPLPDNAATKTKNSIDVPWEKFKIMVDSVGVPFYSVVEDSSHIEVFCMVNGIYFEATLDKPSAEYSEYVANYQISANTNGGYDHAGRQIIRTAVTYKGWGFLASAFDYKTSTGVLSVKDAFGNDTSSEFLVKRFDINGDITTDPALTVRDEVIWKPAYDIDLIAGNLQQRERATEDLRIWVYGGAHELGAYGNKEFARNLNAKLTQNIRTDGKASKHVKHTTPGVPYQTNQITFVFVHGAGYEHELSFILEFYRE